MKKIRISFILALIFLLTIIAAAGCQLVDNLQEYKENGDAADIPEPEEGQVIEEQVQIEDEQQPKENGAEENASADASADKEEAAVPGPNEVEVVLYFMTDDGSSLEGETRIIPKEDGIAKAVMEQLIAGPKKGGLASTLPSSAAIRGINIADGICTVDFSSHLLTDMTEDADDRMLALYSIVNTLTQIDTVDQVRILVEGKTVEEMGGADASAALSPMTL